nr:DUF2017 family protein [Propionibacterium sp.]
MRAFRRAGGGVLEAEIEEFEVALLTSMAEQLQQLLGGEEEPVDHALDAFGWLAASAARTVELDRSDPLIERLFPPAYLDDPRAAADFRRFTEDDARRARVAQARVVLDDLADTGDGARPLRIRPDRVEAWLKTVNALRLSLSVRLRITDEASLDALEAIGPRDPLAPLVDLYDWLGFVLESLLEALDA